MQTVDYYYLIRHGILERYQEPNETMGLPFGANIYRLMADYSLWAVEHYPDKTVVTRIN